MGPRERPRGVRGEAPSRLQIPHELSEGLEDDVGELTDERRHILLADRVGDGHRVGQQEPDRRGGQRGGQHTDHAGNAHADPRETHDRSLLRI